MKREYHLDDNKKNIKISLETGKVEIYRGNIYKTLLCCSDSYKLEEKEDGIKLTRKPSSNNVFLNGLVINSCSNTSIFNGKVISGDVLNIGSDNFEDSNVEIIVPHDVDDLSFDVSIKSGSLIVRDVILKKIKAKLDSGNISMYDVDILKSKLNIMSGSINLEISQSILNYETNLNTMCGSIKKDHIDSVNNIPFVEKRELDANVMSGNVKVLFKG